LGACGPGWILGLYLGAEWGWDILGKHEAENGLSYFIY